MREIAKVALRLFIIMVISGLCLGAAHTVTKEPIALQQQKQAEASRRAVLENAASFEEISLENAGNITECYRALDVNGNPCGYAVSVTAKGFGGTIDLTVGLDDGAVTGVRINSHSETPGLGAKSAQPAFYTQYIGKSGKLTVNKNGASNDSEISAITAATITSQAVTNAVNEVIAFAGNLSDDSASASGTSHQALYDVSRFNVLPDAVSFGEMQRVDSGCITGYSVGYDADGNAVGCAFAAVKEGFGGPIEMTVGVRDGVITGVRFDRNSESPDYGGRMTEESFYSQFTGKSGVISVITGTDPADNEISAITAATSSSQTVTDAVNEVLAFAATLG